MSRFNEPWLLIAAGVLFCLSGIFLFRKNVFEEDRSVAGPVLLLLMGVVLVTIGSAGLVFP
ncbi:MAG: hypothetical protein EOO09_18095 [Chitinophagaceae bacterium]|nr:MAG: hypothetical protein EOO09_18095 [Chitinophagaceae bacterium]